VADPTLRVGITLGDPRGIGPEVAARAVRLLGSDAPDLLLIGPSGTESDALDLPLDEVGAWQRTGTPAQAGRLAGLAIERATTLALAGDIDALVTAPIDKNALHAAGFSFPGHTEMLAHLCGDVQVGMLMCAEHTRDGGALRVLLATTHLPLRAVPDAVTIDRLVEQADLLDGALRRDWGLASPRLALCALNPHASDGGLFGSEEADVFAPAIARMRQDGLVVRGPVPADTVFVRALRGEFDAVIAPYHDVGMAAFKTATFGSGVNVTIGLPFARTSPDHGTALDIAGQGKADATSMVEAIRLAARLSAGRGRLTSSRE
jgi:4-hydroxythreonine-4-phosphate dehydrogenase